MSALRVYKLSALCESMPMEPQWPEALSVPAPRLPTKAWSQQICLAGILLGILTASGCNWLMRQLHANPGSRAAWLLMSLAALSARATELS